MKKLLALVLALVMVMGLSVVSTNAAFTDEEKIEHTEAVEVLTSLGIIVGKGNNQFDPTGDVKRSEMAKMVALLMLGETDDSAFKGAPTDLTDIDGHWAEGWIKFCVSQGIVAGKGNGKFDPDANVTASEAAKMLLVAIGYNADVQGYKGGQWQVNVARDAQISGFYKLLGNLGANKPLSRDEAAQMIYNAGDCRLTTHSESIDSDGMRRTTYTAKDATAAGNPLLQSAWKVITVGETVANYLNTVTLQTKGDFNGQYLVGLNAAMGGATAGDTNYYTSTDYSDLLGQRVVLRYADVDESGAYNAVKDKIVGIYAYSTSHASNVYTYAQTSRKNDTVMKSDSVEYAFDSSSNIASYYVAADGTITPNTAGVAAATADKAAGVRALILNGTKPYNTFKLIDNNGDNKYDALVVYEINAGKVTYAGAANVVAGANTYARGDVIIADSLVKDDYAAIKWNFTKGCVELTEIEKASGKVTSETVTAGTRKVTIDGSVTIADTTTQMTVDNTYDYYALNGVWVASTQTTSADLTSLAFVGAKGTDAVTKQARIYFMDGSNKLVTVDDSRAADVSFAALTKDTFYKVIESGAGTYRFIALTVGSAGADYTDVTYESATGSIGYNGGTSTTNKVNQFYGGTAAGDLTDDTVIFVYDTADTVKVISGAQAKNTIFADGTAASNTVKSAAKGYFTKKVDGLTKTIVGAAEANLGGAFTAVNWTPSATASNYALVTSDEIKIADGYKQYTIWNGAENLTVKDKDTAAGTTVTKFSVVGYTSVDGEGWLKDPTVYTVDNTTALAGAAADATKTRAGYVSGFEKDSNGTYDIYINGTKFDTDSQTVYWTINSAAGNDDEIGIDNKAAVVRADSVANTASGTAVYYQNVLAVNVGGGTPMLRVVIFDTSNILATDAATQTTLASVSDVTTTLNDSQVTTTTKLKAGDVLKVTAVNATPAATTGFLDTNGGAVTAASIAVGDLLVVSNTLPTTLD